MGGHQPRSATAGYGTSASCPIPVRGAINAMGIHRRWPPQKRPSYETGETGGRVICLALPQFPDAHKYQGVLPEIGWFSSSEGA